jgi:cobalt-precorrin-5B (C1)-methyltransferase
VISFVGAGPGAADLVTLRGVSRLASAEVVVWASSLVPREVLAHAASDVELHDSASMTLEDVLGVYAANPSKRIVRLHSGDPSVYGALKEQIDWCVANERDFEIVPGVSSLAAAAATAGVELTVPGLSQSVVLSRLATRTKASVPARESIAGLAAHGATMAVFLSAAEPDRLQAELLSAPSGYDADTPSVIAVRASWPDEKVVHTTIGHLAASLRALATKTTVLVLVGPALRPPRRPDGSERAVSGRVGSGPESSLALSENGARRSRLYSPDFAHGRRKRSLPGTTAGRPARAAGVGRERLGRREAGGGRQGRGGLRTGWTTGTCASAAAKAAALGLVAGTIPASVEVALPGGRRVSFDVEALGPSTAAVVKDAGDDPDCTDGARVTADVSFAGGDAGTSLLLAGQGVGTVTRPGLGLPVGLPAINPVPRRMISASLGEVSPRPLVVTFSVPGGEAMAERTTNSRLGIVGGISILGTTGVVRPFSTAAYRASVVQQIDVASAAGETLLVLATGSRSESAASAIHPNLDPVAIVEVGDFTGVALRRAVSAGFRRVELVAMAGKIAKLASGVMMTHFHRSKVDTEMLADISRKSGAPDDVVGAATSTETARHFFESCLASSCTAPLKALCARARAACEDHAGAKLQVTVRMVDFEGKAVVAEA